MGNPPIPIALYLDFSTITDSVRSATLIGSVNGVGFSVAHAAYVTGELANEIGSHTALLEAIDPSVSNPQGAGYAAITVKKDGLATITGKLADGTAFSAGGLLVAGDADKNRLAFYLTTIYAGKGLLSGFFDFDPEPEEFRGRPGMVQASVHSPFDAHVQGRLWFPRCTD